MADNPFAVIDDGRAVDVPATLDADHIWIKPSDLEGAIGWELKPEGLCQGGTCVPVRQASDLVSAHGVDLAAVARVLDRPLALDAEERIAYLGASAAQRGAQLASLQAPDFTLPDLAGQPHALADFRGRKVLLIAYASW
jgi:hypothetical protein